MMKRLFSFAALFAALTVLVVPGSADAQGIRVGPHLGVNFEGTDLFMGLDAMFGVPLSGERDVWGHVGLDIYPFNDVKILGTKYDVTSTRINIDALLPFDVAKLKVYAGGGLAIAMTSIDVPSSSGITANDTDIGINLMAGVLLGSDDSGMRPFVDLVQTVGAGTDLSVRGGVYFSFGRVK